MKHKKTLIISSTLAVSLSLSSVIPGYSAAHADIAATNNDVENNKSINKQLIDKVDKYITIENNKFIISQEGLNTLTPEERTQVENSLKENNNTLTTALENEDSTQSPLIQQGNKFNQSVKEQIDTKNKMSARAVNTKSYADIEYTWWGAQIFFSHKAVGDLNDYLAINGLVGGLGAAEGIGKFLAKHGLTLVSKFLGPLSLYSGALAWGMDKIDEGKGVKLNCVLYVPATITPV